MKYGFIGTGNMGFPLLRGAVGLVGAKEAAFSTPFREEMERVAAETGATPVFEGNAALAECCDNIVLCVKPQFIDGVLRDLTSVSLVGKTVISIAAGITIGHIRSILGDSMRVARIMPNTPAMVGEGMSCVCFDTPDGGSNAFTEEDRLAVTQLFEAVGKVEILPESLMNAAICANGSSPAYVYMFIEALADSVVKYGIPRKTAYTLAAQTVLGSAKMVLETGEHPGRLKDNVCSPGGTTIAAVEALEREGFRGAVMAATDACFERGEELGRRK